MITKAVIPAAGIGSGLLPITKEIPKEMLPVFIREDGKICLKPILQLVFESLYDSGFREYCIIVGRGKRAIEDYFTPDPKFIEQLSCLQKNEEVKMIERFYAKVRDSMIVYVNQPKPKGIGDAILRAKKFVKNDSFLVHAGDIYFRSRASSILKSLIKSFKHYNADAFLVAKTIEGGRRYRHLVSVADELKEISEVNYITETRDEQAALALVHIYVFSNLIFEILEEMKGDDVLKITDAINIMIEDGKRVYAYILRGEEVVDINVPEVYWEVLRLL